MTSAQKVLVVDDDEVIRDSIVDFLHDNGYQAEGALDGKDALGKLGGGPKPCLILLDLMMPVMDGLSFRQEQMQDPDLSGIPVVVLSAYKDVATRAKQISAAAYLKKPLKLTDLLRLVERHCPCQPQ
jgi:CheY-like chemotaxis protein